MFAFFKKEKWAHVKTITFDGVNYDNKAGKVFAQLYESDKGNRRVETACTFSEVPQHKIDAYVKSTELYHTKIVRWENGRYDPDIPRYSQIGEEDTANALKGRVD